MLALKASIHLLSILFIFSLFSINTNAQGIIVPGPCRRCPVPPPTVPIPNSLPIKSVKIDTKINNQIATTHVEQIFRNDTNATLEGTYFFPIPESASIVEFVIWEGNNRLVGEVRSREEARRIYDEIVRRQRDPGLLEYAGKDLFQASIFPIPPHSDKKLELKYTQVLKADAGTVSYSYPLGTGKNVARIDKVVGDVEIESKDSLRNIYSPSHTVDIKRGDGGRRVNLSFESTKGSPQDFQLFYTVSKEDFGLTLLTHREPGKDGYFLLMVAPKDDWSNEEYVAKDVVFVIDTSGSMSPAGKMDKAKSALQFGVGSLRPNDRFNIISFSGEEHLMTKGLIAADKEGQSQGVRFVNNLRPSGGTNINDSLMAALKQFDSSNRPKILVFITDGLPTVGESNINRIIENVNKSKMEGIRLFTFGVGYDVNTLLLDKLAADNGGVADYVEPNEDIEIKVSNFFAKISHPVLTNIKLDMEAVNTDLIYPRTIPDLFKGGQLTLIGRYKDRRDLKNVEISLTGKAGSQLRNFSYKNLQFPLESSSNEFLPRLWANRRVGWLMENIRSNGEQKELRDEIVDLGTRYGIVTPYTSYLALEPGADVNKREFRRDNSGMAPAKPSAAPLSISKDSMASSSPNVAAETTGAGAVKRSKANRAMQEAVVVTDNKESNQIRTVDNKTFYLRDGIWIDSEFKEYAKMKEERLVFGSDEYFSLIKRMPELSKYFALGEQVIVVYKDRVYRITKSK
jgi:Ca-activated chloride channel homolog